MLPDKLLKRKVLITDVASYAKKHNMTYTGVNRLIAKHHAKRDKEWEKEYDIKKAAKDLKNESTTKRSSKKRSSKKRSTKRRSSKKRSTKRRSSKKRSTKRRSSKKRSSKK